ncbi:drug resistance transporter, EmrB/QacA subfamily [Nocardioides scoriae]|uniref:Drug resistance transporter, EmrB/QacA subfamily n=1 Tax=Nocardioides scoriae TaxID=642780 RepID=A0A1H1TIX2_9ACTN|nr:MDR family MFS transporter [Nocardioides scoriae]SDS60152.1 drug resistance transporter, EmrB/QacA subfamily [Nocardioides scoriae]
MTATAPRPDAAQPSATTPPEGAAPAGEEYTHAQILTILSGLLLGMFLAALDQSIVSTSIRTIADDLQGLSAQAWVTTAYLITSTITTPIYGKLGDLYGRKKLFLFAITLFVIGSAACSFATSMWNLAALRALQGLGAGGLFTLVLAIIGDIVSPRERAKYTGYFMAVFATSSVLGPVAGGLFAGQDTILGFTGWRWVFLINVPIGIAALFVVTKNLHLHHVRREARIDWMGATALVVALVPLLTVAEQGREWGWTSGRSLAAYVIGLAGVAAFVAAERHMGDDALIPLRIFKLRAAAVVIGASVIVGAAMFGAITVLPQYMQIVHGASPTEAGLMMLPMVLGMMSAGIVTGQITSRTGTIRIFPIIGSGMAGVAMIALSFVSADTSLLWVMAGMLFLGLGLGQCMQPLTIIVQNAVPPREIGVATSSATFFRQLGGTLGVAIFLSLLFSTLGENIQKAFRAAGPELQQAASEGRIPQGQVDEQVLSALQNPGQGSGVFGQVQNDSSIIGRMSDLVAHPFQVGFSDSMSMVLLGGGIVMLLAFLVLNLMPAVELRSTSASAAARAEGEAGAGAAPGAGAAAGGSSAGAAASAGSPGTVGAHRADTAVDAGAPAPGGGRHAAS